MPAKFQRAANILKALFTYACKSTKDSSNINPLYLERFKAYASKLKKLIKSFKATLKKDIKAAGGAKKFAYAYQALMQNYITRFQVITPQMRQACLGYANLLLVRYQLYQLDSSYK